MTEGVRGFSLIEALVAMTIMLLGVVPLAVLMEASTKSNGSARTNSLATLLASAKVESLLTIEWDSGLAASPVGTLSTNMPGYVEYLDGRGALLNDVGLAAGTSPAGTVYVRRWSVDALPATVSAVVLQVVVRRWPDRGTPDAVRIAAVRTRE
jgi:hypothetical protein